MIWSLIKVLFFVALAAAIAFGAGLILETPGEVRIAFDGRERVFTPLGFLIALIVLMVAVWLLLRVAGLFVALVRTALGDSTALMRYWDRNRERRGYEAVSQSLIALASGDSRTALSKAQLADRKLNKPELTNLIAAQAAEANGNRAQATEFYKAMLSDEKSRFVGVKGLLRQQLEKGNTDTALKLAEKAFAINPRSGDVVDTLFSLQSKTEDWAGARTTLVAKVRASSLPRDVGRRREAVLLVADALAAREDGNMAKARDSAYQANRIAPELVPAAALAANLHIEAGEMRVANRILKKAWAASPHPDLAAAFAAIAPDEAPMARETRFQTLLNSNPKHPESRLVAAELALAAENFPAARRALGDMAEVDPTTRSLAIMAAIEKGEGAPDTVVRGWLAKALSVPRGEAWICTNCSHAHSRWAPLCEKCDAFDTMEWARPTQTEQNDGIASAMLPLIVGSLEDNSDAADVVDGDEDIAADEGPEADAQTNANESDEAVADAEVVDFPDGDRKAAGA